MMGVVGTGPVLDGKQMLDFSTVPHTLRGRYPGGAATAPFVSVSALTLTVT